MRPTYRAGNLVQRPSVTRQPSCSERPLGLASTPVRTLRNFSFRHSASSLADRRGIYSFTGERLQQRDVNYGVGPPVQLIRIVVQPFLDNSEYLAVINFGWNAVMFRTPRVASLVCSLPHRFNIHDSRQVSSTKAVIQCVLEFRARRWRISKKAMAPCQQVVPVHCGGRRNSRQLQAAEQPKEQGRFHALENTPLLASRPAALRTTAMKTGFAVIVRRRSRQLRRCRTTMWRPSARCSRC